MKESDQIREQIKAAEQTHSEKQLAALNRDLEAAVKRETEAEKPKEHPDAEPLRQQIAALKREAATLGKGDKRLVANLRALDTTEKALAALVKP